ncbi:34-kDa subunit of RNA polymerase III (C) [Malassezia pachydermatis]|uniref:Rpc34-dna-directed rna polymerase 34 kd subunit n=1 Tax=Malassezia pachydermatis TaxID=77020 RepID=A0A0M9VQA1_9BASI|nr:rpc34-dna-directed rna polymerase 34 kd subunit [Malassezia pachydermatis]KOS15309.1 rpc34-dna-directed rna polymerase 34 kd subunit [Malassezia pachydermatis]
MPPKAVPEAQGLSALEKRIHATALAAPEHTLTGDELATQFHDIPIEEQLLAINSLLKKSLFHAQKGPGGIQYVAISTGEASMMGSMDANELIIYNHIKDAKNEGIWTKLIKARTNLHQTVMTRCLRLLEQKQLVKVVKSVKFPTRKIYMLYDLTPSIELSGGPWYTDNELDTGFIHELSMACLRFIQSKTWPKDGRSSSLYPASHTQHLPTAQSVHRYLKAARLTDTELEPEHVVALLDLLIYDQEIEKIPVLPVYTNAARMQESEDGEPIPRRSSKRNQRAMSISDSEDSQAESRANSNTIKHNDSDSSDSSEHEPTALSRKKRHRSTVAHTHRRDDLSSEEDELPHRRPQRLNQEEEEDDTSLTHVPYVYRAIKRMIMPHSSMIATTFVPPDATIPDSCGLYDSLVVEDNVVYADPFTSYKDKAETMKVEVSEDTQE